MIEHIQLKNFKSVRDITVRLGRLTVLTGLNGSGKSTILQAFALLKQSLHAQDGPQELKLRGDLIQLGRSKDVRFENALSDDIGFAISTTIGLIKMSAVGAPDADTLPLTWHGDIKDLVARLSNGFQFIQADRITPAVQYQQASTRERASGWLGCGGQYTVDYLLQNETRKISPGRVCPREDLSLPAGLLTQVAPTEGLLDQTAGWLQQLSPGVRPRAVPVELADAASLRFTYTGTTMDSGSQPHRPTNVGFGLTYCLPIIVACLTAPTGALLLLENPEAHLHPRGQFALGVMLARCAADGVQIVVETHSDHVLNGIRVAAKRGLIKHDDVAVHFFSRDIESWESSVISPTMHANGRLSEWPDGFFDEWSKALDELLD
ncbi:DUF3696 domain-containing protein [Alcaligenes faecalis]|nr:DUF3696 domain-containing protein [Alcaligenes faecalis]